MNNIKKIILLSLSVIMATLSSIKAQNPFHNYIKNYCSRINNYTDALNTSEDRAVFKGDITNLFLEGDQNIVFNDLRPNGTSHIKLTEYLNNLLIQFPNGVRINYENLYYQIDYTQRKLRLNLKLVYLNPETQNKIQSQLTFNVKWASISDQLKGKIISIENGEDSNFTSQEDITKENNTWLEILMKNSINSYQKYLREYPEGKYINQAKLNLQNLEEINTGQQQIILKNQVIAKEDSIWLDVLIEHSLISYPKYTSIYPSGRYIIDAKSNLQKLERINDHQKQIGIEDQIKAIENTAWQETQTKNTVIAYNSFMRIYPESPFLSEAKRRIRLIENKGTPNSIESIEKNMVYVEGNTFKLGCLQKEMDCASNEIAIQEVTLDDYYINKHEVTQGEWRVVMGSNHSDLEFKDCDSCPVERVSWKDAQKFIKKLNKLTKKKYRLPTEAEWEFAAKGGNYSRGYFYSGSNELSQVGEYIENNNQSTKEVEGKYPNELGIFDMSGNVFEWCSEWYQKNALGDEVYFDPKDSKRSNKKVIRGGSWNNPAELCFVTYRNGAEPILRSSNLGFRLAASAK